MAFKALKVIVIGDKTFNPGDTIPDNLVEPRFIKSKKVEEVDGKAKVETIVEDVKVEATEEILIEDSAEVEVIKETPKKGKKKK